MTGEVKRDRHNFLPSTAEFAIEVRERAEMIKIRAAHRQRAIAAPAAERPALSDEARAEVRAKFDGLLANLLGASAAPRAAATTDAMITGTGIIEQDGDEARYVPRSEFEVDR